MGRTLVLALCALLLAGVGPPPRLPGLPPLDPDGETPIVPPLTPHAECIAQVVRVLAVKGGRLQRALVTHSRRWGDVWRADFGTGDAEAGLIGRAVCWDGDIQIAANQRLAPLPDPRPMSSPALPSPPSALRCVYTPVENPCRGEPLEIVSLCVRPSLYLYADGHAETASDAAAFTVSLPGFGRYETDADWSRRCASRGGPYRGG